MLESESKQSLHVGVILLPAFKKLKEEISYFSIFYTSSSSLIYSALY